MNWQAQRTTELSVQVSHLTDTYVQNTQPNLYLLTSRSISGTKITQKLVFPFAGLQENIQYIHSERPLVEKTFQWKDKKKCILTSSWVSKNVIKRCFLCYVVRLKCFGWVKYMNLYCQNIQYFIGTIKTWVKVEAILICYQTVYLVTH